MSWKDRFRKLARGAEKTEIAASVDQRTGQWLGLGQGLLGYVFWYFIVPAFTMALTTVFALAARATDWLYWVGPIGWFVVGIVLMLLSLAVSIPAAWLAARAVNAWRGPQPIRADNTDTAPNSILSTDDKHLVPLQQVSLILQKDSMASYLIMIAPAMPTGYEADINEDTCKKAISKADEYLSLVNMSLESIGKQKDLADVLIQAEAAAQETLETLWSPNMSHKISPFMRSAVFTRRIKILWIRRLLEEGRNSLHSQLIEHNAQSRTWDST